MPSKTIDHAFTARSLTGGATDPTHAGALSFMRRKYTKNLKGADAVVWGIPFDAAVSNRPGARFGPQAIRRASAIMDNDPQYPFQRDLFEHLAVIDYGDCLLDYGNHLVGFYKITDFDKQVLQLTGNSRTDFHLGTHFQGHRSRSENGLAHLLAGYDFKFII